MLPVLGAVCRHAAERVRGVVGSQGLSLFTLQEEMRIDVLLGARKLQGRGGPPRPVPSYNSPEGHHTV